MEKQKLYNFPSGKCFVIKSDVFIIKDGKTKLIKQDDVSKDLSAIFKNIRNGK